MPMDNVTLCAVPSCTSPTSGFGNLCERHQVPGLIVQGEDNTYIITCWYAEHGNEVAIIVLNDWALGHHFSGRHGFERTLAKQGFDNVRNLATPEEVEKAKLPPLGKIFGNWGGPWRSHYPWEPISDRNPRYPPRFQQRKDPSRTQ